MCSSIFSDVRDGCHFPETGSQAILLRGVRGMDGSLGGGPGGVRWGLLDAALLGRCPLNWYGLNRC